MKKYSLNIILFVTTLFVFGVINVVSFGTQDISELENRALQRRPTFTVDKLFSGQFFREYENYFADHFAYRDRLVQLSADIKLLRGFSPGDEVSLVTHNGENLAESEEAEVSASADNIPKQDLNKPERESKPLEKKPVKKSPPRAEKTAGTAKSSSKDKGSVIGGMFIVNDRAMERYSFNQHNCSYYAAVINQLEAKLQQKVKVYSLLAPTQIEFVDRERYGNIAGSQKSALEYINQSLNPGVIPVNAYQAIYENKDKYLYFRTDHHWTALGAYYAYTAFAKASNQEPIPLERYEVGKVEGFLGSTYSATLNKKLQRHPDTIYYYKPFIKHQYTVYYQGPLKMKVIDLYHADKKNKYRIFISGDRPLGKIVTEVENNNKILVIKDSYGNAFIPFLIPHYKEIYIADPRQFKYNVLNFAQEKGIQEVLVLDYINAANDKYFTHLIAAMLNK